MLVPHFIKSHLTEANACRKPMWSRLVTSALARKGFDWPVPCCDTADVDFYWCFFGGGEKQEAWVNTIKCTAIEG